jgi:hypothetical protein
MTAFCEKKAEERTHALRPATCVLGDTPIMVWFFLHPYMKTTTNCRISTSLTDDLAKCSKIYKNISKKSFRGLDSRVKPHFGRAANVSLAHVSSLSIAISGKIF